MSIVMNNLYPQKYHEQGTEQSVLNQVLTDYFKTLKDVSIYLLFPIIYRQLVDSTVIFHCVFILSFSTLLLGFRFIVKKEEQRTPQYTRMMKILGQVAAGAKGFSSLWRAFQEQGFDELPEVTPI